VLIRSHDTNRLFVSGRGGAAPRDDAERRGERDECEKRHPRDVEAVAGRMAIG
jgi:hypothetical protein